jgi:disulfide bond formation protein DsbB
MMALFVAGMSALTLAGALIGQYGFDLHPCDLCIYQRIPFVLNIVLGLLGYFWVSKQKPIIAISGILFLINSGIAMFHSGVERKWWAGLTGCSTPDMSGSIEDLLKRIQETDVVRCDEIPWSLFGLSMANYNVVFCLGIGVLLLIYLVRRPK